MPPTVSECNTSVVNIKSQVCNNLSHVQSHYVLTMLSVENLYVEVNMSVTLRSYCVTDTYCGDKVMGGRVAVAFPL